MYRLRNYILKVINKCNWIVSSIQLLNATNLNLEICKMEVKKLRRLSLKEEIIIQTLLKEKRFKSYIVVRLGRTPSTINRQVNKRI